MKLPGLTTRVLVGLAAGLGIGLLLAPAEEGAARILVDAVTPVGTLWVNAIRMTVVPLLVSLLLAGITQAGTGTVARIGGRTVAWFVVLVAFSSAVGGLLAPPLLRLVGAEGVQPPELTAGDAVTEVTLPPFSDWFTGLLPANPVRAAADGAILPLVLFTVIFGLAAARTSSVHRERIRAAADAVVQTMFVIVEWILAVAPIGVFALGLGLAARTGSAVLAAVAGFLVVACGLVLLIAAALYPLVRLVAGVGIREFARAVAPAQAVGFSTRSSLATLPVMIEAAEDELQLPVEVSGLVLPASVSLLKYASPVVRITGTWFVALLFGVSLGPLEWAAIVAGIGALSFYSPGIPSGGLFVMAPLYQAFGLPLEGIGILIALDIIPDMFITAANVTADLAVGALLGRGGPPSSV